MNGQKALINLLKDSGYLKTVSIIKAFSAIDRADFVLSENQAEAYNNYPLPIGGGQTISQPLTVAVMLELLQPQNGERILDVGAGSGWTSALLAEIVGPKGKVFAVEKIPTLCEFGRANLEKYQLPQTGRVKWRCGDGATGLPGAAPFDRILASAAAPKIPAPWRQQLKIGGVLVAPVGYSIWRLEKRGANDWHEEEHPGFVFVPLV